jgi:hypothetical protein
MVRVNVVWILVIFCEMCAFLTVLILESTLLYCNKNTLRASLTRRMGITILVCNEVRVVFE